MKIIIAGSRTHGEWYYDILENVVNAKLKNLIKNNVTIEIVSGTAIGIDQLGEKYALAKGYKLTKFPANWQLHGKSAGYIRNEEMAKYADALIAFWDGVSKGTQHMIKLAEKHNILVRVIKI